MGAKKYRVEQEGKFLGHHPAYNPKEAVNKAVNSYGKWCDIDCNKSFIVTRGQKVFEITGV